MGEPASPLGLHRALRAQGHDVGPPPRVGGEVAPGTVQHAFAVHGDVTTGDRNRHHHVTGSELGDESVTGVAVTMEGMVGPHRLAMAARQELHATVLDGRLVDGQPARGRAPIVGVDPVRLVLMPGEYGVVAPWLLGQQLVEVDDHALAAELLGDARRPPLEHVALPRRVVTARHHHVDDGVSRRIRAVLPGRHVVEVLAGHGDLAAQEAVVDRLDVGQLGLGEHGTEVDVAVTAKGLPLGVADEVVVAAPARHANTGRRVAGLLCCGHVTPGLSARCSRRHVVAPLERSCSMPPACARRHSRCSTIVFG